MEQIISLSQEKAAQALVEMQKARLSYEDTQDSDWLEISLEWEINAYHYLNLAELALQFI